MSISGISSATFNVRTIASEASTTQAESDESTAGTSGMGSPRPAGGPQGAPPAGPAASSETEDEDENNNGIPDDLEIDTDTSSVDVTSTTGTVLDVTA
ncbi:hypothetical protein [Demequina sp. NBRC 110054]|uniref:hypothetical protein n=1 Tax=Demequina sp. NBRC 110054 TaxID=1570343 RepID=UPI000A0235B3|nr:hypothetical protein [Demequina sp. NBRC 110054]